MFMLPDRKGKHKWFLNRTEKKKRKWNPENNETSEKNRIKENTMGSSAIEGNRYEIKRKAKTHKMDNVLALDNSNFTVDDSVNCNRSTVGKERKFEVKRKERETKKKKQESKQCLENYQFKDNWQRRGRTCTNDKQKMQEIIEENPREIKVKSKKRKIRSDNDVLASDNLNFSLNVSMNATKKTKHENRQEQHGLDSLASNNSSQIEKSLHLTKENIGCDLMLNVAVRPATPKPAQKSGSNFNSHEMLRRSQDTRRKSVRFNEVHEERIIPRVMNKSFGFKSEDRGNFYKKPQTYRQIKGAPVRGLYSFVLNKRRQMLEENVESMAKTRGNYQAGMDNNININVKKVGGPFQKFTNNEMIGMINVSNDRHRKLKDGTQLGFKLAHFNKPPAWYNKEAQLTSAKKSYKHLIVGDIIVGFKNTNLHEIEGYATVESLQNRQRRLSKIKRADQRV